MATGRRRPHGATQTTPGETGLPEIPTFALDDGPTGTDPGGQATGQEAPAQAQPATGQGIAAEVVAQYPDHELVAGRVIVQVDGKREAIAEIKGGEYVLTFIGEQLAARYRGG